VASFDSRVFNYRDKKLSIVRFRCAASRVTHAALKKPPDIDGNHFAKISAYERHRPGAGITITKIQCGRALLQTEPYGDDT
jgi:hypothetical protein